MRLTKLFSPLLALILMGACSHSIKMPETGAPPPTSVPEVTFDKLDKEEQLKQLLQLKTESPGEFRLGKGDILAISVYDEPDLRVKAVPIRPDGKISFPLIGDIRGTGLTVDEVRHTLTQKLLRYLKDPQVSVIVSSFNSQKYTIIGQVVKPGVYALGTDYSLTQAIARAGGLTQGQFHASSVELADLSHAFITRKGDMLPVDFVALLRRGDMRYDLPLHPGDYIYIPSGLSQEIYILGEVSRPDMFAFREGMQLSKALVVAKGFTADANLTQVHLVRGSLSNPQRFIVNMHDVFEGKTKDVALEPGDIVYVPPAGLSRWSRIINRILPGLVLARTGMAMNAGSF